MVEEKKNKKFSKSRVHFCKLKVPKKKLEFSKTFLLHERIIYLEVSKFGLPNFIWTTVKILPIHNGMMLNGWCGIHLQISTYFISLWSCRMHEPNRNKTKIKYFHSVSIEIGFTEKKETFTQQNRTHTHSEREKDYTLILKVDWLHC